MLDGRDASRFTGPKSATGAQDQAIYPHDHDHLLTLSNIFMTFAWYGHLKYRHAPLFKVTLISWLIAFAEYCFQVPANRVGSYEFTMAQLKTIQEVITLTVFSIFSVLYLREPLKWNYLVGFVMIIGAVAVIFKKW
ncbi:MAG TPA: DMT family protein [Terriglobales bacterium]|nr:DMT family protein [Terriglobales bacterium]